MRKVRKIGVNRGKRRLWIEGLLLVTAGFKPQDHYNIIYSRNLVKLVKDSAGNRKVSGKGAKPIIDIIGSEITKMFFGSVPDSCVVETGNNTLIIRRNES